MTVKTNIPQDIKITADEIQDLTRRIKESNLLERDQKLILSFISVVMTLRLLLERRSVGLRSLLRKIFGLKTERHHRPNPPPDGSGGGSAKPKETAKPDSKTHKGGSGRHGQDDYPGAERVKVKHESLKVGSECPACFVGVLSPADDGVAYRWHGSLPLTLTIYELERLICQLCKTTFTAMVPGEKADISSLDPASPKAAAKPEERVYDPSAAASVAMLRFELGVPHYRLADAQASRGVPLPPSTQIKMMEPLRKPAEAVFSVLAKLSGNSHLVIPDDTGIRLLDMERGKVKKPCADISANGTAPKPELLRPQKVDKETKKGPRATTTAIVSKTNDHTICLHYTGFDQAGENLAKILVHRSDGQGPPIQMCDALAANFCPEFITLLGNCLDHARRQFYDFDVLYPSEVNCILSRLSDVYGFDAEAKRLGLDDEERLTWHQMYSAPVIGELWLCIKSLKQALMPNSDLVRPLNYLLKHWDELTLFLRVAGAPLSSAEVERLIKRCIRHRKNSLHYKTLRGARFGDLMMSLIQTCRYEQVSAHDYLTALCCHADLVVKEPENWLPWNYHEAIQDLAKSAA